MADRAADRAGQFLQDILAAPPELAAVSAAQRAVIAGPFASALAAVLARRRRRLVGMGSSRFAAMDAASRWRLHGHDAVAEVASASGSTPGGPDTLAIAISNSGSTAEVVAAARRHRAQGSWVLAMTSRPDSPLAAEAHLVLPLRADRPEISGIATLSFRATVAGLLLLDGDESVDAELAAAPDALAAVIDGRDAWLAAGADLLDTGGVVHVLADGFHAGLAEEAALMLREAPRIMAWPIDTGDWLHVGLYTLLPGDAVLLLTGSPADAEVIETVHRRGGRVVAVGPAGNGADMWISVSRDVADTRVADIFATSAIAELLAAELWRRAGT